MRVTGMSKPTVWRWWNRFLVAGVGGPPYDILRIRGRMPILADKVSVRIALATSRPPAHASHWTLWGVAKKPGIAVLTMFRVLKHNGQKPHRVRTFRVSRYPRFAPKRRGVVGLYVNPPNHAVVISEEAKTRIQALGQTQKPLPMKPGRAETRTHDCKRNGTSCLMAAFDVATAKITGQMHEHHRSAEFLALPRPRRCGDRNLHRAPQRRRCPPVPPEQKARRFRGGMKKGTPEAAGIGIVKENQAIRRRAVLRYGRQ